MIPMIAPIATAPIVMIPEVRSLIPFILYNHRVIQSQFLSFFLNLLFRSRIAEDLTCRIAGRDGLQNKDNSGNAKQDRDQKKDSLNYIF